MKVALKRLQKAGVAPAGETPVDFNTNEAPGRRGGVEILLITNAALY